MPIKENEKCPKCENIPFKYDIVKIYHKEINGVPKRRIRCRSCKREMILPYIIKKTKTPKKGGKK